MKSALVSGKTVVKEISFSDIQAKDIYNLPDDSGEKHYKAELPDDSGEKHYKAELPDDSGEKQYEKVPPDSPNKTQCQAEVNAAEEKNSTTDNRVGCNFSDKPSEEEINEAQKAAIKEAFERIARGDILTTKEVGNLCEMLMDQYFISLGYKPLHDRVTSLDDKGHQGIDAVYEREKSDGSKEYVIADAKYNTAQLSITSEGSKQMSQDWIDKRLDKAVGKEKADEIRDAYEDNPESIKSAVYNYNPCPDVNEYTYSYTYTVDEFGNKNSEKSKAEKFDFSGNVVEICSTSNNQEGDIYA